MTLDEAIESLEQHTRYLESLHALEQVEAHQLGSEALKKWKEYRASDKSWWGNLLPGETED